MSNIKDQIRQEIERRKKSLRAGICNDEAFTRKQKEEMLVASGELTRLSRFLDSLPGEKPIEKDEKIEALIVCDIMEATAKRVNIDKQDKDKEEEAMLKKINYLRNLGLNVGKNE